MKFLKKITEKIFTGNKKTLPCDKIPDDALITRYSRLARIIHWFHLVSFVLLTITGLAFYYPILIRPVGGLAVSIFLHRVIGVIYVIIPLYFIIRYFNKFITYMSEYSGWQLSNIVWLLKFPLFLFFPGKIKLPEFKGKLNPGQKLLGFVMLLASFLMAVSGLVRIFIGILPAGLISGAISVHQIVFPFLILFFLGHIAIGTGIFPVYRGVWRAMLGDGNLRAGLVKIHWKNWLNKGSSTSIKGGWNVVLALIMAGGIIFAGISLLLAPQIQLIEEKASLKEDIEPGTYQGRESEFLMDLEKDGTVSYIVQDEDKMPLKSWQVKDILINALELEKNKIEEN